MKKFICGLHLILLLSTFGLAQKQKDSPQIVDGKETKNESRQTTGTRSLLEAGTSLEARLGQTLDVKKSKVGDRVILTITKTIKQDGRAVLEKGSRLIGRVTEVQAKTKETGSSRLAVLFERVEAKNLNVPINATIVSISQETKAGTTVGETLSSDISENSSSSGSVSRNSSVGGGLLGGVTGTVGGVVQTTTRPVGDVTNATGQSLGVAARTLGRPLDGIQLSQLSSSTAGGAMTLSAAGKNLRLEKGVIFQLRLNRKVEN